MTRSGTEMFLFVFKPVDHLVDKFQLFFERVCLVLKKLDIERGDKLFERVKTRFAFIAKEGSPLQIQPRSLRRRTARGRPDPSPLTLPPWGL